MLNRLMQLVLGAVAKLAGLYIVAAIGVTLWLVREEACKKNARPAPQTINPLQDLDLVCQGVPSFQNGLQALVREGNPPARGPIRPMLCPPSSDRLLLVKNRYHTHHQPASRFTAHIVMDTAKRHCETDISVS